jgi:hypothetical protein
MLPVGLKCFGTIFTSNKLVNLVPDETFNHSTHLVAVIELGLLSIFTHDLGGRTSPPTCFAEIVSDDFPVLHAARFSVQI